MRIINTIMAGLGYLMVAALVCFLAYTWVADLKSKRKHHRQTEDSRWADLLNRVDILEERMNAVEFRNGPVVAEFCQEVKADE